MTKSAIPTPRAPSVDDAIETIRAYVRYRGWTVSRLAKEAGMWRSSLRDFERDNWCPGADTLRLLAAVIPADFDPASAPPPEY